MVNARPRASVLGKYSLINIASLPITTRRIIINPEIPKYAALSVSSGGPTTALGTDVSRLPAQSCRTARQTDMGSKQRLLKTSLFDSVYGVQFLIHSAFLLVSILPTQQLSVVGRPCAFLPSIFTSNISLNNRITSKYTTNPVVSPLP